MELISRSTLREFQDYLVEFDTVRGVERLFEDAGIIRLEGYDAGESSVRRNLIKQYYASLDLKKWSDVKRLLKVFEEILLRTQNPPDGPYKAEIHKKHASLLSYLKRDNLIFKDERIIFDGDVTHVDEFVEQDELSIIGDLFQRQFPAGLPFGVTKPDFAVVAERGVQKLRFEVAKGMGILRKDIYPNLTFEKAQTAFDTETMTTDTVKRALINMNQTEKEKEFFIAYSKTFDVAKADVPLLVPQAWVQWHSLPKQNLRDRNATHADELYRIDFVAFWDNKRYAILIDDISHYGRKPNVSEGKLWIASEEGYSKRLKEDRKLRRERWSVFRISNWEIRQPELLEEILLDLREFIGFES